MCNNNLLINEVKRHILEKDETSTVGQRSRVYTFGMTPSNGQPYVDFNVTCSTGLIFL